MAFDANRAADPLIFIFATSFAGSRSKGRPSLGNRARCREHLELGGGRPKADHVHPTARLPVVMTSV
jgi:hypothetical protein